MKSVTKTIRASIGDLTKIKRDLLDHDYNNYQWWMTFGVDNGLLSCFKAAKGYKQRTIKYKAYPLPLWSALIKDWFWVRENKLTKHWIKIPNSKKKGVGLWLPLKFHQPLPKKFKLKDSYLIKKKNKYYIHFCIALNIPKNYTPKSIIRAIDLGLKNPITLGNPNNKSTKFLGQELKKVKGKYYYIKKKLGKEGNFKQIRKLRNKEKRKVDSLLHEFSKSIVLEAYKSKSAIVVGKLKYLKRNKGRRLNRKLSGFSYYKLTRFIEYKAIEKGIPFLEVNEAYTSKTCSVCGAVGKRKKNWFVCGCGYEDNADRNAAFNIGKRGLSYMLKSGVSACAQKSIDLNGQVHNQEGAQICNL